MSTPSTASPTANTPTALERIFRMGSIELPDIAPDLPPLEALRQYAAQWPHLRRARLSEPVVEGNRLVYVVEKPPVQTKG